MSSELHCEEINSPLGQGEGRSLPYLTQVRLQGFLDELKVVQESRNLKEGTECGSRNQWVQNAEDRKYSHQNLRNCRFRLLRGKGQKSHCFGDIKAKLVTFPQWGGINKKPTSVAARGREVSSCGHQETVPQSLDT